MHKDWKLKETKDRPKSDDDLKTEDSNERVSTVSENLIPGGG
jgi:hypothetical protein